MGERGHSRVAFGRREPIGDGRDTATDGGVDGTTDRARGADRGGRDATGHDPTDVGGGGGSLDRWVIAGRDCSVARGIGVTRAIGGPSDGA